MIFTLEYDTHIYSRKWDGILLWHPDVNGKAGYNVHDIELKKQANHADSLTFTISPGHPEYNNLEMQNIMGRTFGLRFDNNNQFLFYGRGISVESDVTGDKKITCEGALAFLNDILLRPVTFATIRGIHGESIEANTLNWEAYGNYAMMKFNDRMADQAHCYKRAFTAYNETSHQYGGAYWFNSFLPRSSGSVPISECAKLYTGVNDYTPVMDAVNDLLNADTRIMAFTSANINSLGEIDLRLDVQVAPFRNNPGAVMALDKNVVDINESGNSFDNFTAIIPLDKNKRCIDVTITTTDPLYHRTEYSSSGQSSYYRSQDYYYNDGINANGYIERVVEFQDIELDPDGHEDDEGKARGRMNHRAEEILRQASQRTVREYSVNMVDLSLLNSIINYDGMEPFTDNTPIDNLVERVIGRTTTQLPVLAASTLSGISIETDGHIVTPRLGDWALYGFEIYEAIYDSEAEFEHYRYRWSKVENASYIPSTTTPIPLDRQNDLIQIDREYYTAKNGDRVIFTRADANNVAYIFNGTEWEDYTYPNTNVKQKAIYLSKGVLDGYVEYLNSKNFINIGDRVHFVCPDYGIYDSDAKPWVCTSLSMQIDNQGATSYTFSLIDENYIPADNFSLADLAAGIQEQKRRNQSQTPKQSANYKNEVQPTCVVKLDDNHVVEIYPEKEIHYEAQGDGDVRTNVLSYEMPSGTTDPSNPWPEPNEEHS